MPQVFMSAYGDDLERMEDLERIKSGQLDAEAESAAEPPAVGA